MARLNRKANKEKTPFRVEDNASAVGTASSKPAAEYLKDIDTIIKFVIIILLVTVGGIVVASVNMYLDQAHFNNETYKEQSGEFQSKLNNLQSQVNSLKKK